MGVCWRRCVAQELVAVFSAFDRDRNGYLSFDEFMRGIRGRLSERRLDAVRRAFAKLDYNREGVVDVEDIAMCFNPRENPDVSSGKKSERQVRCVAWRCVAVLSVTGTWPLVALTTTRLRLAVCLCACRL